LIITQCKLSSGTLNVGAFAKWLIKLWSKAPFLCLQMENEDSEGFALMADLQVLEEMHDFVLLI
jgi:hypothetical protein